jgi:predicted TIM-barrel fold metal-dependent hydrolase
VPVLVHPPSSPPGGDAIADARLLEYGARAVDVAVGIAALVFAGVLDRHPELTLICAAGGGGLAQLAGRLDAGARARGVPGRPGGQAPLGPAKVPSDYLRRLYVDTCLYQSDAVLLNLAVFGPDRVLFGTDAPPLQVPAPVTTELVARLPIEPPVRDQVLFGNAEALLAARGQGARAGA